MSSCLLECSHLSAQTGGCHNNRLAPNAGPHSFLLNSLDMNSITYLLRKNTFQKFQVASFFGKYSFQVTDNASIVWMLLSGTRCFRNFLRSKLVSVENWKLSLLFFFFLSSWKYNPPLFPMGTTFQRYQLPPRGWSGCTESVSQPSNPRRTRCTNLFRRDFFRNLISPQQEVTCARQHPSQIYM